MATEHLSVDEITFDLVPLDYLGEKWKHDIACKGTKFAFKTVVRINNSCHPDVRCTLSKSQAKVVDIVFGHGSWASLGFRMSYAKTGISNNFLM